MSTILLIQIQVKFLFQIHVRQIVQYNWEYFFLFFYFYRFLKKGPQKAIMSTANEASILTHFHIKKVIMGTVTIVPRCFGYPRTSGIPTYGEDLRH